MGHKSKQVTTEFLQRFADAWTEHDIDLLMSFMSVDPVFQLSSGPDMDGTRYTGFKNVKQGFQAMLDKFPDGKWVEASHFVVGDRGVSEWTFTTKGSDGIENKVRGCDIFTFEEGKISVKNSFRKIII
jgi:hypothetical protein|tara:strand:+ start:209 stop:592 length:384 start_codon:yes stop_codon:yes gene_type:complete